MHGENVDDTTARIVFSCLIYGDGLLLLLLLLPGQDMKVKKTLNDDYGIAKSSKTV